jgi:bleomycin hydrolase
MKKNVILLIYIIISLSTAAIAQEIGRSSGIFIETKSEFREDMTKTAEEFRTLEKEPKLRFKMDFEGIDLPDDPETFTYRWHNEPVSQGLTGTCWCYCSTSFLESDIYRQTNKKLKLSEMHTVYWETVEKARRYVAERGDSHFAQGSLPNATLRIWKEYGVVPYEVYTGLKDGQQYNDHGQMWKEMNTYLKNIKATSNWNEVVVLSTIKSILNHYLGVPPTSFKVNGKKMTPHTYLQKIVKVNPDDYIDVLSLLKNQYYSVDEYIVPDNWWHNSDYYNVPLDDFMQALKNALKNGFTVGIGGDVSESGISAHDEVAMIPSFDIPSQYIEENARQFRFSNRSTTDDHGIHVVGYQDRDNGTWFLIKDSGSGGHTGPHPGYYFYHEDYIKLKMMNFIVHKDAVKELMNKF